MDNILHGLPEVICYIDDILITGKDDEQHLRHLATVLNRLDMKSIKKEFMQYLAKWKPSTTLHHSLMSENIGHFLAYSITMENLFKISQAFYTHSMVCFMQIKIGNGLTDECTKEFEEAKRQLVFANVLSHYNPLYPIILQLMPLSMNRTCNLSCPARQIGKTNFICLMYITTAQLEKRLSP